MSDLEKMKLEILKLTRETQYEIRCEQSFSDLGEKENISYQKKVKESIFNLLVQQKYYYSNQFIIITQSNNTYDQEKFPTITSFSNFLDIRRITNQLFDYKLEDLVELYSTDDYHLKNLISLVIIPQHFHYFLVESDYQPFVDFINSIDNEITRTMLSISAFLSLPFLLFVKETFTAQLNSYYKIPDIKQAIEQSVSVNRGKCPIFIVNLIEKHPKLFKDCFLGRLFKKHELYGISEHYDQTVKEKIIDSYQYFVDILKQPGTVYTYPYLSEEQYKQDIVNNAFNTVLYDSFDMIFDKMRKKHEIKKNEFSEYHIEFFKKKNSIRQQPDHTIVSSNFRDLLKKLPVIPVYDRIPEPNGFSLFSVFEAALKTCDKLTQVSCRKLINTLKTDTIGPDLMLRTERNCSDVSNYLANMHTKHEKSRIFWIIYKNVLQKIEFFIECTSAQQNIVTKHRNITFVKSEIGKTKIDKTQIDPYANPNVIFGPNVYGVLMKTASQVFPPNSQQSKEIVHYYAFKSVTFSEFLKRRPDVATKDFMFAKNVEKNSRWFMKAIEAAIDELHPPLCPVVHEIFRSFDPDLMKLAMEFAVVLKCDVDPLEKVEKLNDVATKLFKLIIIHKCQQVADRFYQYFIFFYASHGVFSNAVYIQQYIFNSKSELYSYFVQKFGNAHQLVVKFVSGHCSKFIDHNFEEFIR